MLFRVPTRSPTRHPPSHGARRLGRPLRVAHLALTLLLLGHVAHAQVIDLGTQPNPVVDPGLPFEIRLAPGSVATFVLGKNVFTPETLSTFLIDIDPFLERARDEAARGTVVVHRVNGERGYLALSTSPFRDGPAFLLTLQGEAVRSFQDEAALLTTFNRLARYLIVTLDVRPPRPQRGGTPNPATSPNPPSLAR